MLIWCPARCDTGHLSAWPLSLLSLRTQVKIQELQDELGCLVAWRTKQLGHQVDSAVSYDTDHFDRSDSWIGANVR